MDRNWEEYVEHQTSVDERVGWVREFDEMMREIPKGEVESLLEVGCSAGRWIRWYKERFPITRAEGVDIVVPKRRYRGFRFREADARELPYAKGSFDLVVSLGLVEHFKEKDRRAIIAEQARVLRRGGHIVTTFPTLTPFSLMYWNTKLRYDPKTEFKHYAIGIREVRRYYDENGIDLVEGRYLGWFFEPFGIPRLLRAALVSQVCCCIGRKR